MNPCLHAVAMMFHVNCSWTLGVGHVKEIRVFQACVKTGGMFLRTTQNGESVPRLSRSGALTSACSLVHVGRALLSSSSLVIALSVVTS